MSGARLIDEYEIELTSRLPRPVVDELLEGLAETYAHQLIKTHDEMAAAHAAIVEFGNPDVVVRAFTHHSPGRRLATALLATGPLVGLAWAAILITSRAWSWPIPFSGRAAFGLALFAAVGALLTATLAKDKFQRARVSARFGALTLIALDATLITAAMFLAGSRSWLLLPALAASALRITFSIQRLPS